MTCGAGVAAPSVTQDATHAKLDVIPELRDPKHTDVRGTCIETDTDADVHTISLSLSL